MQGNNAGPAWKKMLNLNAPASHLVWLPKSVCSSTSKCMNLCGVVASCWCEPSSHGNLMMRRVAGSRECTKCPHRPEYSQPCKYNGCCKHVSV